MSDFVRSQLTRLNRCTTLQQADALRAAVVIAVIFHDDDTIMANAEQALPRDYDVIVYGASGFTGRLVAEHLLCNYGATAKSGGRWPGEAPGNSLRSATSSVDGRISR